MDQLTQTIVQSAAKAAAASEAQGQPLDYSESSLKIVEGLLAATVRWVSALPEDQLRTLVQDVGCYILEVGRREFGGRYEWHAARNQPALVVGEPAFKIALITWDKVRGRLSGDEGDNIPFFYAGFAERARGAAPGDDAIYV